MKIPDLFDKKRTAPVLDTVIRGGSASQAIKGVLNDAIDTSITKAIKRLPGPLQQVLGAASQGGPYQEGRSRLDPLYEVHWTCQPPLGLNPRFVEEISVTESNFTTSEPIPRDGYTVYLAEKLNVSPVTAIFYEDRKMTVAKWLAGWYSLISPDGKTRNYPNRYKQTWTLYLKDVKGVTVGQLNLIGVWPTTGIARNLASLGSERVRVSLEFSVDRIEFVPVEEYVGGFLSTLPGVSSVFGAIDAVSGVASSAIGVGTSAIGAARRVLKF